MKVMLGGATAADTTNKQGAQGQGLVCPHCKGQFGGGVGGEDGGTNREDGKGTKGKETQAKLGKKGKDEAFQTPVHWTRMLQSLKGTKRKDVKEIPLRRLRAMILSIYQEKIKTDGANRQQQSTESLPVFVTEFMLFQYGKRIAANDLCSFNSLSW
jgi:hypothetical protein